jgi:hypothetical protein
VSTAGNHTDAVVLRYTCGVPAIYVRHEALFVRMEVEDLDLSAVVAAG